MRTFYTEGMLLHAQEHVLETLLGFFHNVRMLRPPLEKCLPIASKVVIMRDRNSNMLRAFAPFSPTFLKERFLVCNDVAVAFAPSPPL